MMAETKANRGIRRFARVLAQVLIIAAITFVLTEGASDYMAISSSRSNSVRRRCPDKSEGRVHGHPEGSLAELHQERPRISNTFANHAQARLIIGDGVKPGQTLAVV
jgi:hypothetical protein